MHLPKEGSFMHSTYILLALLTMATATATPVWNHISNTNIFKIKCTGENRIEPLCSELETFYLTAQTAGKTAKEKLRAVDEIKSQNALTLEMLNIDDEEDITIILEHGLNTTIMQPALENELDRFAQTMTLKEDDIAEALWLAPLIIFAAHAGSTQREQRFIFSVLTGYLAAAQRAAGTQQRR